MTYKKVLFILQMFIVTFAINHQIFADSLEKVSVKDANLTKSNFFDVELKTFDENKVNFDKGWIGIFMEARKEGGILVKLAIKGSPADVYGIKSGDIVMGINGDKVEGEGDEKLKAFKKNVEETGKNKEITLDLIRDGKEIELKLTLIAKLMDARHVTNKDMGVDHVGPFISELEGRGMDMKNSFLGFLFQNEKFKDKCFDSLQRLGEEVFVREGYQYASAVNVFRLPLVDYLMSHPFAVPGATEVLHDHFVNVTPLESVLAAYELLGGSVNEAESGNGVSGDGVDVIIDGIISSMEKAVELRKLALGDLSTDELQYMYDNLEKLWPILANSDEVIVAKVLEMARKMDLALLLKSLFGVIKSIPFEILDGIKTDSFGLELLRLQDTITSVEKADETAVNETEFVDINSGFVGDVLFAQNTSMGMVVVGGTGTTYYYDDAAFIFDLGGDDFYFNNAGGAGGADNPVSVCIDLEGDDVYNSKADFVQGAAKFGIGILADFGGDDRYIGKGYCQGYGLFGIGLLIDSEGDDSYNGQSMCQGGGAFGIGFLRDNIGNDRYQGDIYAQGIGFTKGVGGLIDMVGNDSYYAGNKFSDFRAPERSFRSLSQGFGMGIRPLDSIAGASGGVGLLFDESGNDLYHADYFAQGGSYYFSLGVLYDKSGHDRYYAGRYSQGAGIHSSIGVLNDGKGDDMFDAYFGVSQACGFDTGIGYLIDQKGNDFYRSGVMALGAGGEKGLGFLVDFEGDDYYSADSGSIGYSYASKNETFFGIGILADTGGGGDVFNRDIGTETIIYQENAGILMNKGSLSN